MRCTKHGSLLSSTTQQLNLVRQTHYFMEVSQGIRLLVEKSVLFPSPSSGEDDRPLK